jgi:hypothetical protein
MLDDSTELAAVAAVESLMVVVGADVTTVVKIGFVVVVALVVKVVVVVVVVVVAVVDVVIVVIVEFGVEGLCTVVPRVVPKPEDVEVSSGVVTAVVSVLLAGIKVVAIVVVVLVLVVVVLTA